jgi:homoserine kinase type II
LEDNNLTDISREQGITFKRVRHDLPISGSPERCLKRFVIEATDGSLFLLKKISPAQIPRREEMGGVLSTLNKRGLSGLPTYLPARGGRFVNNGQDVYQLYPYIKGIALNRSAYIFDGWRGVLPADFLVNLKNAKDHL